MSRLALSLLGTYQITLDGETIVARLRAKTQALLAYLAVEAGVPHRREFLAGLLWPDQPNETARSNLRQALHQLQQALGDTAPSVLSPTAQTVEFAVSSNCTLDVDEFLRLLHACEVHRHRRQEACRPCAERFRQAVAVYRGDLLGEFFVKDSAAFEEWALVKREQIQRKALTALDNLAVYHARRGEYNHMEQAARRRIELDAFDEGAYRQVMQALVQQGRRGDALAQYEACRRILTGELGVEPSAETTKLYQRIRNVAQHHGDYLRSASLLGESLATSRELGDGEGVAMYLAGLAGIAGVEGQPERAARLFGAAQALYERIGRAVDRSDRAGYDPNISGVRAQLNDEALAAAWAEGRSMTLEQAIAYALGK